MQAPSPFPKPDLHEQMSCAPLGLPAPPLAGIRVLGGYVHGRLMFGPGDGLIVNAGTTQGVQKGQMYFVRRPIVDPSISQPKVGALYGVHTAGWVTIVDVKDTMAVATVTHACEGLHIGDYLEPYVEPVLPEPALGGTPDFAHPGQIMMADELRRSGYPGLVMLNGEGPILDVGRGTVLSVNPRSALMRVDSSREAVYVGDLIAIHRITP
jgi:hypothetical protein